MLSLHREGGNIYFLYLANDYRRCIANTALGCQASTLTLGMCVCKCTLLSGANNKGVGEFNSDVFTAVQMPLTHTWLPLYYHCRKPQQNCQIGLKRGETGSIHYNALVINLIYDVNTCLISSFWGLSSP